MKKDELQFRNFAYLCVQLAGTFGGNLDKTFPSRKGLIEAKRLILFTLGKKRNRIFLKKLGRKAFKGLCFNDIFLPLSKVFEEK